MLKNPSKPFLGFLQASGLVFYIILISLLLNNVTGNFNGSAPEFMAPIIMLLLFVLSAVISALLVLGKSAVLFWEKRYSEALSLVSWTVGWGILYLVIILMILQINSSL